MNRRAPVDLLILGGGCAGLSLGVRLAEQPGRCRHAVLLESRSAYANDRTWCFWGLQPHRHESMVDHAWTRFAVRAGSDAVLADCAATPYQQLRSGAFYTASKAAIDASRSVDLRMGSGAGEIRESSDGGWLVATEKGELHARAIVDTRPPALPARGRATLWQSFIGAEVESADNAFDPGQATLMDFDCETPAPGVIMFTYVLPTSPRRALVETTAFSPEPIAPEALAGHQRTAVIRACGGPALNTLRREHGVLPMGLRGVDASPGRDYVRAGLSGGAARPASGYAFMRIQRWADACAARLRWGGMPIAQPGDPTLTRWMDTLFLRVLAKHPERAPEIFLRLFGRVDTPRLVRFLSDCPTLADRLAVIRALPAGLFLSQLRVGSLRRHAEQEGAA